MHALRAVVRGARAAQLLVQLALRRVRDVRRARHAVPGRPRAASSPTTTSRSTTGAIAPWSGFRGEYFKRVLDGGRRRLRLQDRDAVEEAEGRAQEGRALRHRHQAGDGPLQEPLRAPALVHDAVRGRDPLGRAPPHRVRVRPRRASRSRATCALVPCPDVRRCARLRPGVARGHDRRSATSTRSASCRSATAAAFFATRRAVRARPADRRARVQGGATSGCSSCSTSASTTCRSTARRARSPAARRSASGSRRRSGAGSSACCTCSTSRRSGCTSATTSA